MLSKTGLTKTRFWEEDGEEDGVSPEFMYYFALVSPSGTPPRPAGTA